MVWPMVQATISPYDGLPVALDASHAQFYPPWSLCPSPEVASPLPEASLRNHLSVL
jgi:hypothetical protein